MPRTSAALQRFNLKAATNDGIQGLMLSICGNPILLLETVAGGPYKFRLDFLRGFRGLAVNEDIANRIFAFFSQKVIDRWGDEVTAAQVLDAIEVTSPPTEAEIEASWVHTFDHTSEDARLFFYKDTPGPCITVH